MQVSPDIPIRDRTLVSMSTKGGCGKTTIQAFLAFEFARLGLDVLLVDTDSGGGFSSTTGSYAPEGQPTISDMIRSGAPVIYPIEGAWNPSTDIPWKDGGALIEGGQLSILPTDRFPQAENSAARLLSEAGTKMEQRLAKMLRHPAVAERFDVVLLDAPGTSEPSTIYSILNAAKNVLYPMYMEYPAFEGIEKMDGFIADFIATTDKPVELVAGIPLRVPGNLTPGSKAQDTLNIYTEWANEYNPGLPILMPGTQSRNIVPFAFKEMLPVVTLTSSVDERRSIGQLPAEYTGIALAVLHGLHLPGINVDELTRKLLAQDMDDEWRSAITSLTGKVL